MIKETVSTQTVQVPDEGFDWLYMDHTNEYTGEQYRSFCHEAGYQVGQKVYGQCTDTEKQAYEAAHSTETYAERVNRYIREQYDQARVEALTYNYLDAQDPDSELTDDQRTEYITAYHAYQSYRKECKRKAQEEEPEPEL